MTSDHTPAPAVPADPALAAPPDESNPALIDARKTFIYAVLGAAAFIATVVIFIL